jgi:hypothetical protein
LKYLLANISVVEQNSQRYHIRNHAGYLMKAIEMDYSQSENIEIDDKVQETETKRKFEESIDQQRTINDFIK